MIRKTILSIVILAALSPLIADEKQRLFDEGNTLYRNGDYKAALISYQKILDMGYQSGVVFFNMGNCYYKIDDIGHAILFYERARQLIPGDEDLKANLLLANLGVVDKIEPQPQFILFRVLKGAVHLFRKQTWTWITAGIYILFILVLIFKIVTRKLFLRIFGSRMAVVFGILLLISVLSLYSQYREANTRVEAVILQDRVDVMSAPGGEGVEVFTIHEGTKVRLDQSSSEWVEIILADGKVGWVRREVLEVI